MGKSVWTYIRIFIFVSLLAAVTGCEGNGGLEDDFLVRSFSVSGTVYDSSESLPGVPLEDVTIEVSVYWYHNTERVGDPIYNEVIRTGSDGTYLFYKRWFMTMQDVFYVLRVSDNSNLRSVHFKPVEQELYLRPNTDAYDHILRSYSVKGNDFYLIPESF